MASVQGAREFQRMSSMGGALLLTNDDDSPTTSGTMAFPNTISQSAFPQPKSVSPPRVVRGK